MTVEEVIKRIVETLEELQRISGRPCGALTGATTPIGDLEGFDSLSAIEATIMIEVALGKEFKADNLLVGETDGKPRTLTIAEAAEQIVSICAKAA